MKLHTLTLALVLGSTAAHADHPSVHGMVLFGNQETYVSHLPMFHSPHDYQVVMKVSLNEVAQGHTLQKYVAAKQAGHDFFTLAPEVFDLTKIIDGSRTTFQAGLFDGHFERDGTNLGQLQVQITQSIHSHHLEEGRNDSGQESYFAFGANDEYYAVHLIAGKPSFDAILKVSHPAATALSVPKGQGLPAVGQFLGIRPEPRTLVQKVLYLEVGELAH